MEMTRQDAAKTLAAVQHRVIEKRRHSLENYERIQTSLEGAELSGLDELQAEKIQKEREALEFYKMQLDNLEAEISALGLAIDLLK